jgi:hypothetical protein
MPPAVQLCTLFQMLQCRSNSCCTSAGLTKAGAHCAQRCLVEAQQLVERQPDLTEGARGAAYDLCFSRCAASSPADAAEGAALPARLHRKVAAGGLTAAAHSEGEKVGVTAQAAAEAAAREQRQ